MTKVTKQKQKKSWSQSFNLGHIAVIVKMLIIRQISVEMTKMTK